MVSFGATFSKCCDTEPLSRMPDITLWFVKRDQSR